ncbi:MAG: DUF4412 domain-containing protein [Bacteroidota bacterium]
MKPTYTIGRLLFLVLFTSVCTQAAFPQVGGTGKAFEGVLEYKLQTSDRVQIFNYLIKDERVRVEAADREETPPIIIVDYSFKKTFYILPHREQYVELGGLQESAAEQQTEEQAGVERTGETDEIEGFTCDQLLVKTETGEIEIWATKELGTAGTFYTVTNEPPASLTPWQNVILSQGYFPLRTILKNDEGDELTRFEVSSVKKKSLSESLFRHPTDYEKIGIEQLRPKPVSKKSRTR